MECLTITVKSLEGLHVKPASEMFMAANQFSSQITAVLGEKRADCKNILDILGLGALFGDRLQLEFEGRDEKEAKKAFQSLFE